jgi:hypothetical protein
MAKANTSDRRFAGVRYREDAHWDHALDLDPDDPAEYWGRLDARAAWFYEAYSAAPDMSPNKPGPSSAYLGAYRDSAGEWLDGGNSYVLRVPPRTARRPVLVGHALRSRHPLAAAQTTSRSPTAPRAWTCAPTPRRLGRHPLRAAGARRAGSRTGFRPCPAAAGSPTFRLYNPTQTYFDASWPLPDFEKVS